MGGGYLYVQWKQTACDGSGIENVWKINIKKGIILYFNDKLFYSSKLFSNVEKHSFKAKAHTTKIIQQNPSKSENYLYISVL